jgi:NADH-quinone oxidoreductase subunit H
MAGWSSRNKYSLLGAMRAVAQMISYEVVLLLSSVAVVMITGSLSLPKIVAAQNTYTGVFPHWYIFTPWGLAGFLMYAIAATAETNRSPFDLPEGESELVAGYHTEYSGFKFALFFSANTWPCFPSPASAPRCFSADGQRHSHFLPGFLHGSGSSAR